MTVAPTFGPSRSFAVRPVGESAGQPRWVWYAVGAVVAVGLIVVLRRSGSAASTNTPLATTTPDGSTSGQLDNLTAAVQGLISGFPAAASPTTMTNPYIQDVTGSQFYPLASLDAVMEAKNAGLTVYYQPIPGEYAPIPASMLYAGSGYGPTYLKK